MSSSSSGKPGSSADKGVGTSGGPSSALGQEYLTKIATQFALTNPGLSRRASRKIPAQNLKGRCGKCAIFLIAGENATVEAINVASGGDKERQHGQEEEKAEKAGKKSKGASSNGFNKVFHLRCHDCGHRNLSDEGNNANVSGEKGRNKRTKELRTEIELDQEVLNWKKERGMRTRAEAGVGKGEEGDAFRTKRRKLSDGDADGTGSDVEEAVDANDSVVSHNDASKSAEAPDNAEEKKPEKSSSSKKKLDSGIKKHEIANIGAPKTASSSIKKHELGKSLSYSAAGPDPSSSSSSASSKLPKAPPVVGFLNNMSGLKSMMQGGQGSRKLGGGGLLGGSGKKNNILNSSNNSSAGKINIGNNTSSKNTTNTIGNKNAIGSSNTAVGSSSKKKKKMTMEQKAKQGGGGGKKSGGSAGGWLDF